MKRSVICLILTLPIFPEISLAQTAPPDDHVALTELAYTALVKGHDADALKLLQQATAVSPEDPRANVYLAIAFYRLGRVDEARRVLATAQGLDVTDPLPWLAQSVIDVDLFNAASAVATAQQAHSRSATRVDSDALLPDLRGSTSPARAFAFAGLDDWADHVAHESYAPWKASSHLVLSDRYSGVLNKRSELFQGLLADPRVLGASPRFETLLARRAIYTTAGVQLVNDRMEHQIISTSPYATVNGFIDAPLPLAYTIGLTRQLGGDGGEAGVDVERRAPATHFAFGLAPSPRASVFVMVEKEGLTDRYEGASLPSALWINHDTHDVDVGVQYRFSLNSALSLKVGSAASDTLYGQSVNGDASAEIETDEYNSAQQLQFRHTFNWSKAAISWGAESVSGRRELDFLRDHPTHFDTIADTESADVTARVTVRSKLTLDVRLGVTRTTDGAQEVPLVGEPRVISESTTTHATPRLGFAYHIADGRVFRIAYQRWVRSAADSTLAPIASAGIAPHDLWLARNGVADSARAQLEWTWDAATFVSGFVDFQQIDNPEHPPIGLAPPESTLWGMQRMTRANIVRQPFDELLSRPLIFDRGSVTTAGLAWNRLIRRDWAARARYTFGVTDATDVVDATVFSSSHVPRHLVAFGATWTSPRRLQVGGDIVYRSRHVRVLLSRRALVAALDGDWQTTLRAAWELPNKRWSVDLVGYNLGGGANQYESVTYTANVRFRY